MAIPWQGGSSWTWTDYATLARNIAGKGFKNEAALKEYFNIQAWYYLKGGLEAAPWTYKAAYNELQWTSQPALPAPGKSAAQAWSTYVAGNGPVSELGAATGTGLQASQFSPVVVTKPPAAPAGSTYGLGGILSANVGTVGAAIAPLIGVALGAGLYESNPELWEKISRALIPWAYPDGDGVMVMVDENGQTYLPKEAIEAVKRLFEEEGISSETKATSVLIPSGVPIGGYSYQFNSYSNPYSAVNTNVISCDKPITSWLSDSGRVIETLVASTAPVIATLTEHLVTAWENGNTTENTTTSTRNLDMTYTYDGKTVYYRYSSSRITTTGTTNVAPSAAANPGLIAWTIVYGTITGYLPDGISNWHGDSVDISTLPTLPVVSDFGPTSSEDSLVDWIPVSLPYNGSEGSLDPAENPDPTQVTDPTAQIDPYWKPDEITLTDPTGNPVKQPVPKYDPDPNPNDEPQKEPQPQPYDPTQYPDPTKPSSEGDIDISPEPIPPLPWGNAGGLIAVYHPSQSILETFAQWLWVTWQDATTDKIWNNPFDGVISLHEIYCTPPDIGTRNIKSGFLDSGISCPIVARYTEIDCGSIVIPEYWGNYLDYSPYSRAYIYLPFIGIVEVDVDDIVGHAINITYRIDVYNGSCIAVISVAKNNYNNIVYQFSGNCAVELPLSGGSQAAIKASLMQAAAYGLGSVISGAIGALAGASPITQLGGLGQAASGVMQASASVLSAKSSVAHSGTFGSSFGAMGNKKPFIIIRRPIQVRVPNYNEQYGFQAHKLVILGQCTGYVRCREIHVISSSASDQEKMRIEEILKTGAYITE